MNRFVLSVSRCLILAVATAWATASLAQGGPPGGLNVNVLNTPLAVTGTVTVANSASAQIPKRFNGTIFDSTSLTNVIPKDAVPAGKVLVVSYVSAHGVANNTAAHLTAGECTMWLISTPELSTQGGLPVTPGVFNGAVSQATYLPINAGESVSLSCFASGTLGGTFFPNLPTTWWVSLSGYLTDAQ